MALRFSSKTNFERAAGDARGAEAGDAGAATGRANKLRLLELWKIQVTLRANLMAEMAGFEPAIGF
jgi:hypothetical protein